ncbi:MAG: Fe-S cluster assembly protein SufB [Oscillospiraceae bacterium]|nr:Fe-S cluster assembly protein SufB [Oscillospiraceae bacterium]
MDIDKNQVKAAMDNAVADAEQENLVSPEEITRQLDEGYKYGFRDEIQNYKKLPKGINEDVVREISRLKNEPAWMTDFRVKSYRTFAAMPMPSFGHIGKVDFQDMYYYVKATEEAETSWDDVPEQIKDTFEKLGIPQAEREYLAGVTTQYESEVVYHKVHKELDDLGVIFTDTDTALKEHPEIFKKYFGKLVPATDNKFAALNSAVWSGGSFIYVPKGVTVPQPLQSYFRINSEKMGQFERTLIIVDEGADLHYVEGCTAPNYTTNSLHAAIVEIFVEKGGRCRYTTIQNWSDNVFNLVTKRAVAGEDAQVEWIDGNIGSHLTMKYPAVFLRGARSKGTTISIAVAGKNQTQDAGSRMIHIGPDTSSTIIPKSIARNGGNATYRGTVNFEPSALRAKAHVECDTLILDEQSKSDTLPTNRIKNGSGQFEHEATVSKISEEKLFYLMSRGIPEEKATEMIIMGFIEPFTRELPMEYAIELNQLMKLDMSSSVG